MSLSSNYLKKANFAYERIVNFKVKLPKAQNKLKSYALNVPMYIKTNGLLATVAFIRSKMNKKTEDAVAYKVLYDIINDWLIEIKLICPSELSPKNTAKNDSEHESDLTQKLVNLDSNVYRSAEREILSLFNWVRRFAEGELKGEDDELQ